jgi:hypothetical protein
VQSIDGVEPALAPLKTLEAPPIGVQDEPSVPLSSPGGLHPDDPDPARLTLRGPVSIDAASASNVSIEVTLRNEGKREVSVRFRPETLRFEVVAPAGPSSCQWPTIPAAAMRDMFTTLQPGKAEGLAVLLGDYCDDRPFDHPGLLVVHPQMDTRKASGADIALKTFDGQVAATVPTLIRLHQGIKPPHLHHPHLEPLPGTAPPVPPVAPVAPVAPGPSAAPSSAPSPSAPPAATQAPLHP